MASAYCFTCGAAEIDVGHVCGLPKLPPIDPLLEARVEMLEGRVKALMDVVMALQTQTKEADVLRRLTHNRSPLSLRNENSDLAFRVADVQPRMMYDRTNDTLSIWFGLSGEPQSIDVPAVTTRLCVDTDGKIVGVRLQGVLGSDDTQATEGDCATS